MPIKKQEFYEGAALHLLARRGGISGLRYDPPFFILNEELTVYLKYSTKGRSPWGFSFAIDEQSLLYTRATGCSTVIGLVCGADGVAAIGYEDYVSIAARRKSATHISCYRRHGEHYEINGPDGRLSSKVPPSNWQKLLQYRGK
jgi:hypothetical protein